MVGKILVALLISFTLTGMMMSDLIGIGQVKTKSTRVSLNPNIKTQVSVLDLLHNKSNLDEDPDPNIFPFVITDRSSITNFGEIWVNSIQDFDFHIKNISTSNLNILEIGGSKCRMSDPNEYAGDLEPNGIRSVRGSMQASQVPGEHQILLCINTNQGLYPLQIFTYTGMSNYTFNQFISVGYAQDSGECGFFAFDSNHPVNIVNILNYDANDPNSWWYYPYYVDNWLFVTINRNEISNDILSGYVTHQDIYVETDDANSPYAVVELQVDCGRAFNSIDPNLVLEPNYYFDPNDPNNDPNDPNNWNKSGRYTRCIYWMDVGKGTLHYNCVYRITEWPDHCIIYNDPNKTKACTYGSNFEQLGRECQACWKHDSCGFGNVCEYTPMECAQLCGTKYEFPGWPEVPRPGEPWRPPPFQQPNDPNYVIQY